MERRHNVAVIMDGNGRWAKAQGKSRSQGHKAGSQTLRDVTIWSDEMNIKSLTFYAFSTENWKRDEKEIKFLMKLPFDAKRLYFDEFSKKDWKLNVIGIEEGLDKKLVKMLKELEEDTKDNKGLLVNLALNYGSRNEIVRSVNKAISHGEEVNEETISKYLDAPEDIDLLIRTSGEQRISNFLLWQISYAELHFTETLWPDLQEEEYKEIIRNFEGRKRRFGGYDEE